MLVSSLHAKVNEKVGASSKNRSVIAVLSKDSECLD
jgi:hypothetical protein